MTQKLSRMLSDTKTIVSIIVVLLALAGWAFGLQFKVAQHDTDIGSLQVETKNLKDSFTDRTARIETKIDFLVERERARKD
jgi:hypothetical protein